MSVENDIREAFRARAASVRPSKRAWSSIVRRLDVEAASTREGEAVASVRPADVIHLSADPESAEPEAATERERDRRFERAEDWIAAGPTEKGAPIRVLLVGDQPVWRNGVRAALDRLGTAVTVGEVSDWADAVGHVRATMPDVVVMAVPKHHGIAATFSIVETFQHVRVLAVSDSESRVLKAIKFGAHGCILKSATSAEIVDAVTRVAGGEPVFTPSLAGLVLSESRRVTAAQGGRALTPRENDVLTLIAKGYPYRDIAQKLFIEPWAVRKHVRLILMKLQAGGRYALSQHAIEKGSDGLSE